MHISNESKWIVKIAAILIPAGLLAFAGIDLIHKALDSVHAEHQSRCDPPQEPP